MKSGSYFTPKGEVSAAPAAPDIRLRDFCEAAKAASSMPPDWRAANSLPGRVANLLCQSGDTNKWQVLLPAKLAAQIATALAANDALAARRGKVRADALEEAARLCAELPKFPGGGYWGDGVAMCVNVIRALASQAEGDAG